MHCEQISEKFADYLVGALDDTERAAVEKHLSGCMDCQSAVTVWNRLGDLSLERPRPEMKSRFQDVLWQNAAAPAGRVIRPMIPRPVWTWAAAAALLVCGWLSGRYLPWLPASRPDEVATLRSEVRNLREAVIVSMLRQDSASDRLKGVLTSATLNRPDSNVTQALIDTLHRDSNVNVRLAAVDALKRFGGDQSVRTSFIDGLSASDSPIVQIAIIDALVELRAKQAAPALKHLETSDGVESIVKQRARLALETIQ